MRGIVKSHTKNQLVGIGLWTEATHNQQGIRTTRKSGTNVDGGSLVNKGLLMNY